MSRLTQVLAFLLVLGQLQPLVVLTLLGVVEELQGLPCPGVEISNMVQEAQGHVVVGQGTVVLSLHLGSQIKGTVSRGRNTVREIMYWTRDNKW